MSRGCSHGERRTQGTGDDREAKGERGRVRPLRYKISAPLKRLKWLTMLKAYCNLRYKISCSTNRLFSLALSLN
jgi:hypothetical protein